MFKLDNMGYFSGYAHPSMPTVTDMWNLKSAMNINPTRQSENFLSKHYDDQTQMFVDDKYRPQLMNEVTLEEYKSYEQLVLPKD
jgi:penicillin amidase